jgi:hypothetical protein
MNLLNVGLIRLARYGISICSNKFPFTILAWQIDPSWKMENRFAIHPVPSIFIGIASALVERFSQQMTVFSEPPG